MINDQVMVRLKFCVLLKYFFRIRAPQATILFTFSVYKDKGKGRTVMASKVALSNSVYVSMHYNQVMHAHGVSKANFAISNVIKQLIHAFSCASSNLDELGKFGEAKKLELSSAAS